MLTVEKLKAMVPGTIFAEGIISNNPEGVFMTDHRQGDNLRWIAKRGEGWHDWAIYCDFETKDEYGLQNPTIEGIARHGQKVHSEHNIKKLVECDDESYQLYRT